MSENKTEVEEKDEKLELQPLIAKGAVSFAVTVLGGILTKVLNDVIEKKMSNK